MGPPLQPKTSLCNILIHTRECDQERKNPALDWDLSIHSAYSALHYFALYIPIDNGEHLGSSCVFQFYSNVQCISFHELTMNSIY